MTFIHLAARRSMRDGLRCLTAIGNRLYHWGLKNVARSTFADANTSRPAGYFQDLFAEMYALCRPHAPKHKFRFKCKLYCMDATTISLCLSLGVLPLEQGRGENKQIYRPCPMHKGKSQGTTLAKAHWRTEIWFLIRRLFGVHNSGTRNRTVL